MRVAGFSTKPVDEALEKLNQGTYGTCEECGNPSRPGRLRAIPLANLCVVCQSNLKKEMSRHREGEQEEGQGLESPDPDFVREVWDKEGEG